MKSLLTTVLLAAALAVGCSDSSNPAGDAGGAARDGAGGDGPADDGATKPDAALPAGPLQIGAARARIPCPLGIGTAGFAGFSTPGPRSPFANLYPATTHIHGHPELRAVAISRGPGHEAIFLRLDAVGMFQQLREAVLDGLKKKVGRSLDHALVIGATHTHSGPGRVIGVGGTFDLIADSFFPEYYERLVAACVDVVAKALDDMKPGEIAWAFAREDKAIDDRRCEDGKTYVNGALPVLAARRDGKVYAVVFSYPVHGTVLDIKRFHLSRDVSGAIEQAIENTFAHPVQAVYFNGWGADVAPGSPPAQNEQPGAQQPDGYDKMERIGAQVARTVSAAVKAISTWQKEPTIALRTHRARIDRKVIGYDDKTFPYPYGGVYCGQGTESDCDVKTTMPGIDGKCVPFNAAFSAPRQTVITIGQLAGAYLVTFPGECGTLLGEAIASEVKTATGAKNIAFFGYSQDYLGYSIREDDWWQGGYEAGGALWGPRQGEYLKSQIARFATADAKGQSAGDEPAPTPAFVVGKYDKYTPTAPVDFGKITLDVKASYKATEIAQITVAGADPWLGAPLATLEKESGEAVARPNGAALTSDGYAFAVDLTMTPSYKDDPKASQRRFDWRVSFALSHKVPGMLPKLRGRYRLRVDLPRPDGKTETVRSAVFEVVDP